MPLFSFQNTFRITSLKTLLNKTSPNFSSNRTDILKCFLSLALHTGHLYTLNPFQSASSYIRKLSHDWTHAILVDINLPEDVTRTMLGQAPLDIDEEGYMDIPALVILLWELAVRYRREDGLHGDGELGHRIAAKVLKYGLRVLGTDDLGAELVDEMIFTPRDYPGAREHIFVTMEMKNNGEWRCSTWIQMPFVSVPGGTAPVRPVDLEEVVEMCHGVDRQDDGECTICFEKFVRKVKIISCGHCFCVDCLQFWVQDGAGATDCCPLCRTSLRVQGPEA